MVLGLLDIWHIMGQFCSMSPHTLWHLDSRDLEARVPHMNKNKDNYQELQLISCNQYELSCGNTLVVICSSRGESSVHQIDTQLSLPLCFHIYIEWSLAPEQTMVDKRHHFPMSSCTLSLTLLLSREKWPTKRELGRQYPFCYWNKYWSAICISRRAAK